MKTTITSTSMQNQAISDYLQNGCTRAEALRTGQLHDITHAPAVESGHFTLPTAITVGLWHALGSDQPFAIDHPVLLQLCRIVAAAVMQDRFERRQRHLFSETVWIHASVAGQRLHLKLVCHPGDTAAPVITVLLDSESAQFEL